MLIQFYRGLPQEAEEEIKEAFEKTLKARKLGEKAKEVADFWFFETVVRLHREGEEAPYTGLKPAGLDAGPVIPRAEEAIEKEDSSEVIEFVSQTVKEEIQKRFEDTMAKKDYDKNNVKEARAYINAMLKFMLFSLHLYDFAINPEIHE